MQNSKPLEISPPEAEGVQDTVIEGNDVVESTVSIAITLSWYANWILLILKLYCFIISSSKSVAAALADSVVDLLSQCVLALAVKYINIHSEDYPVGRSRLEALSVLACATLMIVASVEVIQGSITDMYSGFNGRIPILDNGLIVYIVIGVGVGMKLALGAYCIIANKGPDGRKKSDQLEALAEDHMNDVVSNTAAIITLAIALHTPAVSYEIYKICCQCYNVNVCSGGWIPWALLLYPW